jgi:hypothetical protein
LRPPRPGTPGEAGAASGKTGRRWWHRAGLTADARAARTSGQLAAEPEADGHERTAVAAAALGHPLPGAKGHFARCITVEATG